MASEVNSVSLPSEMWHVIFDDLSGADLHAMSLVNKELHEFVLDYLQKNFEIPSQSSPEEDLPLRRIFQEAVRVVGACSSSSSDVAIDLKTMDSNERLDLIDAGYKKIADLWKRRGYDRAKLPVAPPFRPAEFQELQVIASGERMRILSAMETFGRIALFVMTIGSDIPYIDYFSRFEKPFIEHFVNVIYPQLDIKGKVAIWRGIHSQAIIIRCSGGSNDFTRSLEGILQRMGEDGGVDQGAEEVLKRSVSEEYNSPHGNPYSELVKRASQMVESSTGGVFPYILRVLYHELSEESKTALKWEIFLQNNESLLYAGEEREDLGQFVIDDAVIKPRPWSVSSQTGASSSSAPSRIRYTETPSRTHKSSLELVQEAARTCRLLMTFKRWEELPEVDKLQLFSTLAIRAIKMPSQQWLIDELTQKFITLQPKAQISKLFEILKECYNHQYNPEEGAWDSHAIERGVQWTRRLYDALAPEIQENIRHHIFVINGSTMERSTHGVGGQSARGYTGPEQTVTTEDLGRYVIEHEFSSHIVLEALRRCNRILSHSAVGDLSDTNPAHLFRVHYPRGQYLTGWMGSK